MKSGAARGRGSAHLSQAPAAHTDADPADQLSIQRTLARYASALDQQDLVALPGVLTEDATWTITLADEVDLGPLVGRQAILDFVREAMDSQTDQRRHHLTNVVAEGADDGSAVARAYLLLTSNAGESSRVVASGLYVFTMERADFEWRIGKLFLGMDSSAR